MAQIAAMRPDRIVSPDQRSLIGSVYVKGAKGAPNPRVVAKEVELSDNRFAAKLTVSHGPSVRAHLVFRTGPEGTLQVQEKLVAAKDVTVMRIATGMLGILNNKGWIYETGERTVSLDGKASVVPAHSGKTLNGSGRGVVIDGVLTLESERPLRVRYAAARGPERGRATDRLYVNYRDETHVWKSGETISSYKCAVRIRR